MKSFKDVVGGVQSLNEGIIVHGNELAAYVLVLAEQYKKLPTFEADEAWRWKKLVEQAQKLLPRILSKVEVEYTEEDPYRNEQEMVFDIIKNKRLKIFKSQGNTHPGLSDAENDVLRTEHDFFGHYAPNSTEFRAFLKDSGIDMNAPDAKKKIKEFRFNKNSFTVRGEMSAYLSHTKIAKPEIIPALFTEVVGQVAVFFATNNFTNNKVAVFKGVDFKNVGRFTDQKLEARKQEILKDLNNPDVLEIRLIGYPPMKKSKIRWDLLSRGEGLAHKEAKGIINPNK